MLSERRDHALIFCAHRGSVNRAGRVDAGALTLLADAGLDRPINRPIERAIQEDT
jgi:hypothetical protein